MIVLWVLTLSRVDKLFWVPNGCKGPGDYTHLRTMDDSVAESTDRSTGGSVIDGEEKERERGSESEAWLVDVEKDEVK